MTTINESNIFDRGMLIHLSLGGYAGRSKLPESDLGDLPKEIVRGVFDLFDNSFKSILAEILSHDGETRTMLKSRSIPFPIDGVYFIGSDYIESMIETLEKRQAERQELVEKAVAAYSGAISTFAEKYPHFYEKARHKYLSVNRFRERFYFQYQFIKVTAPDATGKFISPEMYKREMAKFKETIEAMKKETLATIYTSLLEATERLKKQCTDGKPSQRTFNNLNAFLQQIDEVYKDFVDRDDMLTVIKSLRAKLIGIDAEQLRTSDELKTQFRKEITAVTAEIRALPDVPLKRAIDF